MCTQRCTPIAVHRQEKNACFGLGVGKRKESGSAERPAGLELLGVLLTTYPNIKMADRARRGGRRDQQKASGRAKNFRLCLLSRKKRKGRKQCLRQQAHVTAVTWTRCLRTRPTPHSRNAKISSARAHAGFAAMRARARHRRAPRCLFGRKSTTRQPKPSQTGRRRAQQGV